jgi:tRNA-intron endonuclease
MALFVFKKGKKEEDKKKKSPPKKKSPSKSKNKPNKSSTEKKKKENSSENKKPTNSIVPKTAVATGPNEKDIKANLISNILTSNSKKAYTYYKQSNFGEKIEDKIKYMLSEGLFLVQNEKMDIYQGKKLLTSEELISKFTKIDKKFPIKYAVYKDLRIKGYTVKTAIKFGAEFRVYDKGQDPTKSHSKWIAFAEDELNKITWHDFTAKNRVATSTNKTILLAIVGEEGEILYYEIKWSKP